MYPRFSKTETDQIQLTIDSSSTCVLCKVLEHIVASGLSKHFTNSNTLYELQHGFREKRSYEKQLIDKLDKNMQTGFQTDLILGPILFLAYINDLPEQVKSKVRFFADDIAMYLPISSLSEASILQDGLIQLEKWGNPGIWILTPTKRQVLHITRSKTPRYPV